MVQQVQVTAGAKVKGQKGSVKSSVIGLIYCVCFSRKRQLKELLLLLDPSFLVTVEQKLI